MHPRRADTLRNCTFRNNWAAHHAAVNDHGLSTVIENCTFRDNFAGEQGASLNIHSGSATVTGCAFVNNSSGDGGAVWTGHDDDPTCETVGGPNTATFTNCVFTSNQAFIGGGMDNNTGSRAALGNCVFSANSALVYGGGLYTNGEAVILDNCAFLENSSMGGSIFGFGGGILSASNDMTLTACTFKANTANVFGGGIFDVDGRLIISNCVFVGNTAGGGGAMAFQRSTVDLMNCTLLGNSSSILDGGGITATLTNCILWANGRNSLMAERAQMDARGSDIDINYSCLEGWAGGGTNIGDDPRFVDPEDPESRDDPHLRPDSPAINAGDPSFTAQGQTDIDGEPRVMGGRVDMGADEFYCATYGDVSPPGGNAIVDIDDLLCVLAGFGEPADCPDADIFPCGGNGTIELDDLLAVLEAFAGMSRCLLPCP